jgi:hypothetical protein
LGFVYEHELAHAWERANLTDEIRREFVDFHRYSTWADPTVPWNERGIEGVALVIQQGLAGLPLPQSLSTEHRSRLAGFALLTGRPAPSFLEWCATQTEHRAGIPPTYDECNVANRAVQSETVTKKRAPILEPRLQQLHLSFAVAIVT